MEVLLPGSGGSEEGLRGENMRLRACVIKEGWFVNRVWAICKDQRRKLGRDKTVAHSTS